MALCTPASAAAASPAGPPLITTTAGAVNRSWWYCLRLEPRARSGHSGHIGLAFQRGVGNGGIAADGAHYFTLRSATPASFALAGISGSAIRAPFIPIASVVLLSMIPFVFFLYIPPLWWW